MSNNQVKLKQIFWPTISDIKSAKSAAMQGVWASIFVAFFTSIAIVFRLANTGVSSLWDVLGALIVAWTIFKMSRIGAVLGLLIYVVGRIYISYELKTISTGWLFVLFYINSIRGTFAYHRFMAVEIKSNPVLIKPKLKHSKFGKYSLLIFTVMLVINIAFNFLKPGFKVTEVLAAVAFLGGIIGCLIGSILGVIGIFQKNHKKMLPILGFILNTGVLIFILQAIAGFSSKTP